MVCSRVMEALRSHRQAKIKGGDWSLNSRLPRKISSKDDLPNFAGPFVQGPAGERFVYINIGTYAGQLNTPWSRRLKIPLS